MVASSTGVAQRLCRLTSCENATALGETARDRGVRSEWVRLWLARVDPGESRCHI